jgi:hypothetical protein
MKPLVHCQTEPPTKRLHLTPLGSAAPLKPSVGVEVCEHIASF